MRSRPREHRTPRCLVLVAFALAAVGCLPAAEALPDPLPGYTPASADAQVALVRAVADYYTVRRRAVLVGDASVMFAAYPKLAHGEDLREGINLDAFFVRLMRDGGVTKVTVELEWYDSMRVYMKGSAAVAFVHGVESWHYPHGGPGSGEFFTRIDLVNDADRWVVERTDEQTMSEGPPRTPTP